MSIVNIMRVDMLKRFVQVFLFLIIIFIGLVVRAQNNQDIDLANQYYENGEFDKALALYQNLAKSTKNIPLIHQNYFKLLMNTGRYAEAETYIDYVINKFPSNLYYEIDKGTIYAEKNDQTKETQYFSKIIDQIANDPFKVRMAAQHMVRNQLNEFAIEAYKESRKKLKDPHMYAIEMANVYRLLNNKQEMIEEYLNYVNEHPDNQSSIKNVLQSVLKDDKDLEVFENMMYDKVQKEPNNVEYVDLLIWVNLQRKNFYAAFIQARALDKRQNLGGMMVMEIGRISLENKDYKNATRIFDYVINEYPGTVNYQIAKRLVIKSREDMVKNTYPVDLKDIKLLIADYENLIKEVGINNNTIEALRSKALLHAFYLNQYDSAIEILKKIISFPRVSKSIVEQSKLDLGDIYLLIGQPWESTLLYSQVEKTSHDTPIGYEAKLRNAKLSYYKGDFALAQEHLDILKMATSREIANDAMALSLLIKENTMMDSDTTNTVMKKFAAIDLLIFQNKKTQAIQALDTLRNAFPNNSLDDEILWREANLHMELGQFDQSIALLNEIVKDYGSDILGDDACFLMGKIYDEQLHDSDNAMKVYMNFLEKYPGSLYAAEARKRFRTLRGDSL